MRFRVTFCVGEDVVEDEGLRVHSFRMKLWLGKDLGLGLAIELG